MKKALSTALIIVVIIALAGVVFFARQPAPVSAPAPVAPSPDRQQTPPVAAQATVTYDGSVFAPAVLTVASGTTVTFRNMSSKSVWVASNPHPIHTGYPGFDAGRSYDPGESYSFTFSRVGTWGYHNHLDPAQGGKIIVQ